MSRDTASTNNPILQGYIDSDVRVDRQRRYNRMMQFKREMEEEQCRQKIEEESIKKTRAVQREAALAEAVGQQKMTQLREEKEIQKVRDDPELRELRRALAMAEITRERCSQYTFAKHKAAKDRQESHEEDARLEAYQAAGAHNPEVEETHKKEMKMQQKAALEKQMQDRDESKVAAYKEFLKEKQLVDEVVRRIQEEDERERVEQMGRQRQTQEYIQDYLKERSVEKLKERERREEEDRQILEYMKSQAKRKEDEKGKAQAKHEQAMRILEEQSRVIADKQRKKDEMEDILNEYYNEQRQEKERLREQTELEKKIRDRVAMIEANEHQKRLKAAKAAMEKREEDEFRQMMMEKFAEDDRIEQMNAVKRNQRRAEHNREVQRLIDQRRAMRMAELEREVASTELEKEREARRRELIEQERKRLLDEHAQRLQAYLPKGVLRQGDFETFGLDPTLAGTLTSLPKIV